MPGGEPFKVLSLFAGIGGFDLGLERTGGFETVAFCEIDPFCQRVLAKHWPGVPCYDDVRNLTAERLAADGVDANVIVGGFPCQDISEAGKGAGLAGERSGLWSEIARLAGELRPQFVIVENVANLLAGPSERPGEWFGVVLGDLASLGYDAEWHCIPAAAVDAPHRRDRVWIVAYPQCGWGWESAEIAGAEGEPLRQTFGQEGALEPRPSGQALALTHSARHEGQGCELPGRRPVITGSDISRDWQWAPEPALGRVADGIPDWAHRIKALGNAVVPQIPELIGRAILAAEGRKATNEPPEREAFPSFARAPLGGGSQTPCAAAPFLPRKHEGGFYADMETE